MLIRLCEYNFTNEDESGLENPRIIRGYQEENFDKLVNFLKALKGYDVKIGDTFYTIDDLVFQFPKDSDSVPCLDIMCLSY